MASPGGHAAAIRTHAHAENSERLTFGGANMRIRPHRCIARNRTPLLQLTQTWHGIQEAGNERAGALPRDASRARTVPRGGRHRSWGVQRRPAGWSKTTTPALIFTRSPTPQCQALPPPEEPRREPVLPWRRFLFLWVGERRSSAKYRPQTVGATGGTNPHADSGEGACVCENCGRAPDPAPPGPRAAQGTVPHASMDPPESLPRLWVRTKEGAGGCGVPFAGLQPCPNAQRLFSQTLKM